MSILLNNDTLTVLVLSTGGYIYLLSYEYLRVQRLLKAQTAFRGHRRLPLALVVPLSERLEVPNQ